MLPEMNAVCLLPVPRLLDAGGDSSLAVPVVFDR